MLAGVDILKPLMTQHGFVFEMTEAQPGSGGLFVEGVFRRSSGRTLKLWLRESLSVTYCMATNCLTHDEYMRFLDCRKQAKYPTFSDNPLDAFEALASDLADYCADFLSGDGRQFQAFCAELSRNPSKFKGFGALE